MSAELPVDATADATGGATAEGTGGATAASRRLDVGAAADVKPGTMLMTWVDGTEPVLVVNVDGAFHAVQGICSHEYFELDKGFLTDGSLTCALHLSRFDLDSGDALDPPADEPLAVYPVTSADGRLIIEFPG